MTQGQLKMTCYKQSKIILLKEAYSSNFIGGKLKTFDHFGTSQLGFLNKVENKLHKNENKVFMLDLNKRDHALVER